MKKFKFLIGILGLFMLASVAYSAPTTNVFRTIIPEQTLMYDLGSPTRVWNNIYGNLFNLSGVGTDMLLSTDSSGNIVATSTPQVDSITATSTSATSLFSGILDVAKKINTSGTTGGYYIDNNLILQASSTNYSTLVGDGAGAGLLTDGLYNTAIGYQALNTATSGDNYTAIGYQSMFQNTTGEGNTAIGYRALFTNETGNYNVAIGENALSGGISSSNIAIGYDALRRTTGGSNVAIGKDALRLNTTGFQNFALGSAAMEGNLTGNNNMAIGIEAMFLSTAGSGNVSIGKSSMRNWSSTSNNVAIGDSAMSGYGTTGPNNTIAIGSYAGKDVPDNNNVFIGYRSAFQSDAGSENVMIGMYSGYGGSNGYNDTVAIGYRAGFSLNGGDYNTLLGYQAGQNISTGNYNLIIGYDINAPSATDSNQLSIGNLIFGTGLDGTGTTISSGNIGIGTTTPFGKMSIQADGSIAFAVATTTGVGEAFKLDEDGIMVERRGIFCEIYSDNGMVTTSIPTGTTYTMLDGNTFGSTTQAYSTKYCTPTPSQSIITITKAGVYRASINISFSGTPNSDFIGALFADGIEQNSIHFERKLGAGGDVGSASAQGYIRATSTTVVDFRARHRDVSSEDYTVHYGNVSVEYIGN